MRSLIWSGCLFVIIISSTSLITKAEGHIFARFIRRWSGSSHSYDDGWHDDHEEPEWQPWTTTKTKTIVKIKPVIKVKHVVKEIPVYKTVKVYKTIPVYKEVPVVKEVKVVKHIHVHKKEIVDTSSKGWEAPSSESHGVYYGEAKHAPHDLIGKVHGGTVKDSGSGSHHQWPANAEDQEKIWSEKGWQQKETPTYATTTSATHSTGGGWENGNSGWNTQSTEGGSESGKHWLPPQGWVPPQGWQPPPGWQAPPGWKEWVQKRKSSRKGTVSSRPVNIKSRP